MLGDRRGDLLQATGQGFCSAIELTSASSAERRQEPRLPLHWPGRLTVLGAAANTEAPVEVVDISPSGIGLHCPVQLQARGCIAVRIDRATVFGEVVYCHAVDEHTFRAGAMLINVFRPNPSGAISETRKWSWLKKWLLR